MPKAPRASHDDHRASCSWNMKGDMARSYSHTARNIVRFPVAMNELVAREAARRLRERHAALRARIERAITTRKQMIVGYMKVRESTRVKSASQAYDDIRGDKRIFFEAWRRLRVEGVLVQSRSGWCLADDKLVNDEFARPFMFVVRDVDVSRGARW